MNNIAPEQIAQNFKAMGDSVWLINAVIANTTMQTAPVAEKKATVARNVAHLALMRAPCVHIGTKKFYGNFAAQLQRFGG